jgi:hypothetical protein
MEMAFSGESSAVGQEDPVFSLDTGLEIVPDGGPSTGKEPVQDWQTQGNRLVDDVGNFIKVIDDGVEKYVEIL